MLAPVMSSSLTTVAAFLPLMLVGGIIGVVVGLVLAFGASVFMAIPFAPQAYVVILAFGFSALIGVIFGYFPARKAARLDPIDALRHE